MVRGDHYLRKDEGWQEKLKEYCAELQGQRLVWSKDADPETIKLLKAQRKANKLKENTFLRYLKQT